MRSPSRPRSWNGCAPCWTPAAFEEAWVAGRALSQPDAVALALAD